MTVTVTALDTSVAVPFLMASHPEHRTVVGRLAARQLHLTAHSLAETYAVLTRLPGDARVEVADAAALLGRHFGPALLLPADLAASLPALLAQRGIAGGATYDAMVGLAAREADATLVTRDARALGTYQAVDARVEVLG